MENKTNCDNQEAIKQKKEILMGIMMDLNNAKEEIAKNQDILAEKRKLFDLENKELIHDINLDNHYISEKIEEIKKSAMVFHKLSDESKFFGIQIKKSNNYNFEEKDALDWATKHNLCLGLDKRAFKKMMKADPKSFEFVKVVEDKKVHMPSKIVFD